MAQSFRMVTPYRYIKNFIDEQIEDATELQLRALDIAGEIAIKNQTLAHKYLNQTGNLSSSIGYLVLFDGRVVGEGGFEKIEDGSEGVQQGEDFVNSLISQNNKGLALIVVAGMNYSVHVENMALDVLTTAELVAEKTVKQLLKAIG